MGCNGDYSILKYNDFSSFQIDNVWFTTSYLLILLNTLFSYKCYNTVQKKVKTLIFNNDCEVLVLIESKHAYLAFKNWNSKKNLKTHAESFKTIGTNFSSIDLKEQKLNVSDGLSLFVYCISVYTCFIKNIIFFQNTYPNLAQIKVNSFL